MFVEMQVGSAIGATGVVVIGVATHIRFFHRGEHHMNGIHYLQTWLGISAIVFLTFVAIHEPLGQALLMTMTLAGYYHTGLFGSLIICRTFFSPLQHFPGPLWVKISSLSFSIQLRKGDSNEKLLALHQKYGDFVRTGSSDLSTVHPKAISAIYGQGSRCVKADWYDLTLPMVSMQTTRDRPEHDKRRRIWGPAFNDAMLHGYEDRVVIYQDQLITHISDLGGKAVSVSELFNLYSYDVMGDLAFGTSFNMLQNNQKHWAIKLLHRGMWPLGLMLPTWCFRLLLTIPGAAGDWFAFKDYCCQRLDDRMNVGKDGDTLIALYLLIIMGQTKVETPNIMSFLLDPWKDKKPTGSDLDMLQGDTQLIIVAGSDTTSSTMTSVFYELAKWPIGFSQLQDEIDTVIEAGETTSNYKLQHLELLNGIISETLRLHPPTGLLQRKTPPEGLTIGETYVPRDTTVFCPQYVVGRNETIYTNAVEFRPERWYKNHEMIKEPSAYAPFSKGHYNCIGKPLALQILRTTLAKLVLEFDVSFAPGEDGAAFSKNARTQFTTTPGELYLKFSKRKK